MVRAQGLIADILATIDRCELCGEPAVSGDSLEIYTIETLDPSDLSDIFQNIVVLCPGCKEKFDGGIISRKHLKACVRLRPLEMAQPLEHLLDKYHLTVKQQDGRNGQACGTFDRLVRDQASFDRLVFGAGILIIFLGIFLFVVGYQSSGAYGPSLAGTESSVPGYDLFNLFLEIAGVALAFIGLFLQLSRAKKPSGPVI